MCSVIAGISAGLSALSGYAQYQQQKEAIENQASMYRAQADAAEQNARVEAKRQEQIADKYGEEARRLRSRQRIAEGRLRAQTGAAGLDMSGSSMDILSSGQDAYWQDQMTLLGNQRNDNYASRVQQTNYLNEAAGNRTAASNLESQLGALKWNTILGTAASIAGSFGGGGSSASSGGSPRNGSIKNPYTYTGASGITWNTPLRLQLSSGIRAK